VSRDYSVGEANVILSAPVNDQYIHFVCDCKPTLKRGAQRRGCGDFKQLVQPFDVVKRGAPQGL
jgi:hypothetical protein